MELSDALTITALGMAVVFSGLLLTAGLIVVFGRLQVRSEAGPSRDATEAPTVETGSPTRPDNDTPPLDPEILTVITTVLEVEHRLHRVAGPPRSTT